MKGRKSSSNSREGGKPRWKDKRKGNLKIKWPCVRSGPITERRERGREGGRERGRGREGEREREERERARDASPAMSIAIRIPQNTEEHTPAEPRFYQKGYFGYFSCLARVSYVRNCYSVTRFVTTHDIPPLFSQLCT